MGSAEIRGQYAAQKSTTDDMATDINPSAYVPNGLKLVHSGLVWKLNTGANPDKPNQWLRRKMWLTSAGVLYYFSRQHNKPLGRAVSAVRVRKLEWTSKSKVGFAFDITPKTDGDESNAVPTVLATFTSDERDVWMQVLQNYNEEIHGEDEEPDPLGEFLEQGLHRERRPLVFEAKASSEAKAKPNLSPRGSPFVSENSQNAGYFLASMGPSAFQQRSSMASRVVPIQEVTEFITSSQEAKKLIRHSSQEGFSQKENTVLILDWDDTIFPTTWIRQDLGLHWKHSLDSQVKDGPDKQEVEKLLATFCAKVRIFLKAACSIAHVVIVTLARNPWIQQSADNFVKGLPELMKEMNIKVVYARDYITKSMQEEFAKIEFKTTEQELNHWTQAKARAMQAEIEAHYKAHNATWKNIISFGDSEFEQLALLQTGKSYVEKKVTKGVTVLSTGLTGEFISKDGHLQRVRSKTVKMLGEPGVDELIAEIDILTRWLPHIVTRDEGLDIPLDTCLDNDALSELHKHITGTPEDVTWEQFMKVQQGGTNLQVPPH